MTKIKVTVFQAANNKYNKKILTENMQAKKF